MGAATGQEARTMTDREYNGWTNWETWSVALYVGEGVIDEDTIRDAVKEHEGDAYAVGQWVRDRVEEYVEETLDQHYEGGLAAHFARGCLGSVDWYSIGSHYVADYAPEAEESEGGES